MKEISKPTRIKEEFQPVRLSSWLPRRCWTYHCSWPCLPWVQVWIQPRLDPTILLFTSLPYLLQKYSSYSAFELITQHVLICRQVLIMISFKSILDIVFNWCRNLEHTTRNITQLLNNSHLFNVQLVHIMHENHQYSLFYQITFCFCIMQAFFFTLIPS